ncbi:transcription antitermination factor NusB [Pseudahrensia aquimaris]|uniref:Transcription antitermination protein NusB n=1 Tax=Pseudahrensia aquimaris TaxID=744461 RepID=A0ABW3FDI3_9HYPH
MSKPANKRGAARLSAVQALYQMDVGGSGVTEVVAEYENFRLGHEIDGETYLDADASWFRGIVGGVYKQQREIDPIIHQALTDDWPLSRIDSTLRAVLRAAVFELKNRADVGARVIVSEYVEVAKAFFDGDEPKMVNGVLDKIARQFREGELDAKTTAIEPVEEGDAPASDDPQP